MDSLDIPPSHSPPPPPKRFDKPKITLQIPTPVQARGPNSASSVYWGGTKYYGKVPQTATSHISDPHGNPYFNPFLHMYHNKASDFMFKQFEGFKDFTMNTAKSGLSAGEKSAFWFYNKLKLWSKKWFTHFFLTLCLVLYSIIGATIFMALEGPNEEKYDKNLTDVRREVAIRIQDIVINNQSLVKSHPDFLVFIEGDLAAYEENFIEYLKHVNNNETKKKTWGFWNAMFYAGTIYTTIVFLTYTYAYVAIVVLFLEHCPANIGALELSLRAIETLITGIQALTAVFYLGMIKEEVKSGKNKTINSSLIKSESVTQTKGKIVVKSLDRSNQNTMETDLMSSSIRKRRNLSKNRGQIMRQREKTPEPSRTAIPHEDTTSEDEDIPPQRTSREIEADNTYEEMKRLVQEQANVKDPVYDIDTEEILEARCFAANERRRRSISPFAIPDKEELIKLERKGSFIDPSNKLLSTNYSLSPKDDGPNRRDSLTLDSLDTNFSRNSLSPPTSPKERQVPQPLPSPTKKMEEIVYFDELKETPEKPNIPLKKKETPIDEKKPKSLNKSTKDTEPQLAPGELVTKVIQVERTPSKKLLQDSKPLIEIRERVVRTPSKKTSADSKPNIKKPLPVKVTNEPQNKVPPVKPARSKSSSRIASKTSESEMSEDQSQQSRELSSLTKRKVVPTPRRFIKNRSPRANRSQSVTRVENVNVLDKTATGMSQTSHEIIELMQKARARSLSIPKDDPKLPSEYKKYSKILQTPNKTPVNLRQTRGISCPKTIQIISDKEILCGLTTKPKPSHEKEKHSRQSSGYVDASQSEYTSSCYSSSPSENEYDFDLLERSAELTRKLKLLSTETDNDEIKNNFNIIQDIKEKPDSEIKSSLRKRSIVDKNFKKIPIFDDKTDKKAPDIIKDPKGKDKKNTRSRFKLLANWHQFKNEHMNEWRQIILLRNKCICNLIILVTLCGLGGMMFKALEGSFENAYKCSSRNVKRDFIESLWRGSHYLREEDWKSMARKKLHEFEDQLHTAHEAGVTSYSGQRSWNFMNSFVYCMTLVTTIGYGHIAPKTTYGRVATIVYAIIGIPLFLIVLADFGKLFTRIIKFFWSFIRRFYYTRSCRQVRRTVPVQEVMKGLNIVYDVVRRPSQIFSEEDVEGLPEGTHPPPVVRKPSDVPPPLPPKPGYKREIEIENDPETPAPSVFEIDDEFNLPISVAIFILVVYIIIGAVGYNSWEDWSFFESFYFVFISMSTIGLGDLVPNHPMFMMASILYLVFGLALTSMCINVVQVKLSDTFKQASAKIGATIGLKVAEEDGSLVPITPPPVENVPVHKPKVEIEDTKSKEVKDDETKTR